MPAPFYLPSQRQKQTHDNTGEKPVVFCAYFRNICDKCKCAREHHDIYHEDFVNVRERLGWETPRDPEIWPGKERTLQAGYTWIPAGLSFEKVTATKSQERKDSFMIAINGARCLLC